MYFYLAIILYILLAVIAKSAAMKQPSVRSEGLYFKPDSIFASIVEPLDNRQGAQRRLLYLNGLPQMYSAALKSSKVRH